MSRELRVEVKENEVERAVCLQRENETEIKMWKKARKRGVKEGSGYGWSVKWLGSVWVGRLSG